MSNTPAPLVTVKKAAEYLCVGVSTLNRLRITGGGPRFAKIGNSVRYRIADLDRYVERHIVKSTADAARKLGAA
jgi:excisionase family DNA binding protein